MQVIVMNLTIFILSIMIKLPNFGSILLDYRVVEDLVE